MSIKSIFGRVPLLISSGRVLHFLLLCLRILSCVSLLPGQVVAVNQALGMK